jgi:hypothetical protein
LPQVWDDPLETATWAEEGRMYHYYFDFEAGQKVITDEIGLPFSTPEDGRNAALIALSEVFVQEIDPDLPAGVTVIVRDDRQVVYSAAVTLSEAWILRDRR